MDRSGLGPLCRLLESAQLSKQTNLFLLPGCCNCYPFQSLASQPASLPEPESASKRRRQRSSPGAWFAQGARVMNVFDKWLSDGRTCNWGRPQLLTSACLSKKEKRFNGSANINCSANSTTSSCTSVLQYHHPSLLPQQFKWAASELTFTSGFGLLRLFWWNELRIEIELYFELYLCN